jgi:DNA-binding NarL/FixJ family response regulator
MNTAVRRSPSSAGNEPRGGHLRGERKDNPSAALGTSYTKTESRATNRTRVYIGAENRLLREALSRMLMRRGDIEVVGGNLTQPFLPEVLLEQNVDVLLLTVRGNLAEDTSAIRRVRATAPAVQVLIVGLTQDEGDFLQYVRAGIKGYLPRDASSEDVIAAVRAVQAGEAVCPGSLCAALFRFFEREANSLPSASVHHRLGLTRREQQIVPLIAQGLTNKEIANQFCLSEQTVKNHLYRMKHKIGAPDRLGIVHLCRTQGFLV